MAAGGQVGEVFRRRLSNRFIWSRGTFVPNGKFAFVASSQYISLQTDIQTHNRSIHGYIKKVINSG
jgi:hypothetical protein